MFPLRDSIRTRSLPIITWVLIIVNVLVFFVELTLSTSGLNALLSRYAIIPAHLNLANPSTWLPLFTHMFLHGGWFHLISNMWTLAIFGDNVEDRLGSFRFLLFYLLGGVAAGFLQAFLSPDRLTPALGASGAIAAVLGAYFLFYPRSRVVTLIPVFVFPWIVRVPALLYLGFWFVSQLFSGLLSLFPGSAAGQQNIAWWAHIGGFVFGLVAGLIFAGRRRSARYLPDEY